MVKSFPKSFVVVQALESEVLVEKTSVAESVTNFSPHSIPNNQSVSQIVILDDWIVVLDSLGSLYEIGINEGKLSKLDVRES